MKTTRFATGRRAALMFGISLLASPVLVGTAARPAQAQQDRGSMTWNGMVEGTVRIRIVRDQATVDTLDGAPPRDIRTKFNGGLPAHTTLIGVTRLLGRGEVRMVQTPRADNRYTCIIEIVDRPPGADVYSFRLDWAPDMESFKNGIPGDSPAKSRAYDAGRGRGEDDKRAGRSRDYRRYSKQYDRRTEDDFRRGYESAYDGTNGSGSGSGAPNSVYRVGYDAGRNDRQTGQPRDTGKYRRIYQRMGDNAETEFIRGYNAGYDSTAPAPVDSDAAKRAYDRGNQAGRDDRRDRLSRDYRRHSRDYTGSTERDYERGYNAGFDAGSSGNNGGSLAQRAYQRGYDAGRNDRHDNLSRDYRRYSQQYDTRTERDFERGYNEGYDRQ